MKTTGLEEGGLLDPPPQPLAANNISNEITNVSFRINLQCFSENGTAYINKILVIVHITT